MVDTVGEVVKASFLLGSFLQRLGYYNMDVRIAINARRAIKSFDANHTMSDAEIEQLLSLAICSPTAFNIQNWRFVIVQDKALRKKIRAASWDQAQVTDASLLVILTADLKSWEKQPERYWQNAPQMVRDFIIPAIDNYYRDQPHVERDEAMRSCGMAAMTLMLAAQEMGYTSCPMDGFDFETVGQLIHLPSDHIIAMFVAIGKEAKPAWPHGGQLPLNKVVIYNRFN